MLSYPLLLMLSLARGQKKKKVVFLNLSSNSAKVNLLLELQLSVPELTVQ